MSFLLDRHAKHAFQIFMNDHVDVVFDFESMYIFLAKQYFSRIAFESIYLLGQKTYVFVSNLELLEFEDNSNNVRSSLKHFEKVLQ